MVRPGARKKSSSSVLKAATGMDSSNTANMYNHIKDRHLMWIDKGWKGSQPQHTRPGGHYLR